MKAKATITSKGQLTLPISVRRQMGLREGDQVEFHLERGVTTLKRFVPEGNPFRKWAGKLGGMKRTQDAVTWQRELRDEG